MRLGPSRGVFAGLADQSGFTEAECRLAARMGRLASLVQVAELRNRSRRAAEYRRAREQAGYQSAYALARLQVRAETAAWLERSRP